jgi:hypothetical protein
MYTNIYGNFTIPELYRYIEPYFTAESNRCLISFFRDFRNYESPEPIMVNGKLEQRYNDYDFFISSIDVGCLILNSFSPYRYNFQFQYTIQEFTWTYNGTPSYITEYIETHACRANKTSKFEKWKQQSKLNESEKNLDAFLDIAREHDLLYTYFRPTPTSVLLIFEGCYKILSIEEYEAQKNQERNKTNTVLHQVDISRLTKQ